MEILAAMHHLTPAPTSRSNPLSNSPSSPPPADNSLLAANPPAPSPVDSLASTDDYDPLAPHSSYQAPADHSLRTQTIETRTTRTTKIVRFHTSTFHRSGPSVRLEA